MTRRVLALRADASGCALYRIWEPFAALRAAYGDELELRDDDEISVEAVCDVDTGVYTVLEVCEDIDVLVVQRPVNNYGYSLIKQARAQGITTVVDLDDDLEAVHPRHVSYFQLHPDWNGPENSGWVRAAAAEADLVTVSTPALAAKYHSRTGPGVVLPNFVPRRIFDVRRRKRTSSPSVGWPGFVSTHPEDLLALGNAIRVVTNVTGSEMVVVGDGIDVARQLGLPHVVATGGVPLADYYQTVVDHIDVGVVPLEDNEFNHAKSYLKMLEMSALGIPVVASPTTENLRLHADGVGVIAETPGEWKKELLLLMRNPRARAQLGARSREVIMEKYVYDQHTSLWFDAWLDTKEEAPRRDASSLALPVR